MVYQKEKNAVNKLIIKSLAITQNLERNSLRLTYVG